MSIGEYEDPENKKSSEPEQSADNQNSDFQPIDPDEVDSPSEELSKLGETDSERELVSLKDQISTALFAQEQGPAEAYSASDLRSSRNVVGVGLGRAEIDFESAGLEGPGETVLNVYVVEQSPVDIVKSAVVDSLGIRAASSDAVRVNVVPVGVIDTLGHRARHRPAPGGVSVGHHRISAGTLGVLARGRSGVRQNRVLILSNNHVLANSNDARAHDSIIQPGSHDRGRNPQDRIAVLERWVPIKFDGKPNYVDCATGWAWHNRVRKDFFYQAGQQGRHFRVGSQPKKCSVGLMVGKSGRTTGLTMGSVYDCNADVRVNFGRAGVAAFKDQITIRGTRGEFSQGGDSGSLIWTWDSQRQPVGLLFAGGRGYTFANKIGRVLQALDVSLYT